MDEENPKGATHFPIEQDLHTARRQLSAVAQDDPNVTASITREEQEGSEVTASPNPVVVLTLARIDHLFRRYSS